jgi:hypothetical protein
MSKRDRFDDELDKTEPDVSDLFPVEEQPQEEIPIPVKVEEIPVAHVRTGRGTLSNP